MDESNTNPKETCTMHALDREGHVNLCCCYIMDEDGRVHDPCYHPVNECCQLR